MTNNSNNILPETLSVSSNIHVNECNNDTNVTQSIQSENDIFS